jgi:hypothetical protein
VIVNQASRFALDPNAAQLAALASHVGASRKAFNWALALVKAQMGQRAAEKTYGLTGDQLTPAVGWSLPSLRKAFTTRQDASNRWVKANADRSRAHARIANLRRDGLHKLTSNLAAEYGTVVVEDLRVGTFVCDACGLVLDRDLNAARNLALLMQREAGTGVAGDPEPQGSIGRGADRKTPLAGPVALKRPPQLGTVGRKQPTADPELTKVH